MDFGFNREDWEVIFRRWEKTRKFKTLGQNIILFDEIGSTSSHLKENIDSVANGTIIVSFGIISEGTVSTRAFI